MPSAGARNEEDFAGPDHTAITSTILDYFEGWFEADPSRMERALHPDLAKRTPGHPDPSGGTVRDPAIVDPVVSTTASSMIEATMRGVGRTRHPGGDLRIEVAIEDIHDTIANVTVRSAVYREYVQLVRTTQGWKIVNTLWLPT